MNRRVFALAAVGSIALHAWIIWPSRPPSAPDAEPEAAPPTRVAVREVDADRIERMRQAADRADAEVPPPPAEPVAAPPVVVAREPMVAEAPRPAPAPAQQAAPAPAPSERIAAAPQPAAEPRPSPAPIHAPPPSAVAVVESADGADAPASEALQAQIEDFEARSAMLRERLPSVEPPPAPASDVPPMPAPASAPVAPATVASAQAAPMVPARREIPPVEFAPRVPRPAPKSPAFPWLKREGAPREVVVASASSSTAQRAAGAGAPAVVPASVPMRIVPREPVPYRPVNLGGGRGGAGRSMSAAFGQAVDRGSMEALAATPPQDPVARIAWGDPAEATRLIDVGRMALVTVDQQLRVVGALEFVGGSWRRSAALPDLSAYSNRVRVVDHVAGFSAPASLCRPEEHLAVVVPVGLERRIDRAMDEAARRQGLSRTQVAACYGRLVTQPTGLEFEIDRVERRNGT